MEDTLAERLREKGEELRANHDDSVIADTIGEVEASDAKNSDVTASILRTMVGEAE